MNQQQTSVNFTQFFAANETTTGPLAGYRVGIKDLFDVKGYVTRAGSKTREALPPADEDSTAVAKLRATGAKLAGHTNMTEFAYSGLGLNPHYGTPMSPLIEGAIAGGSTSGGASALAHEQIDIALGTDTGGSSRIPAAFCGVVGFKPTAQKIPSKGVIPLSHTLDSVGILSKSVSDTIHVFDILKDIEDEDNQTTLKFVIPKTFGMTELDPKIEDAFWAAINILKDAGFPIEQSDPEFLDNYNQLPIWHFSAVESRLHHADAYENHKDTMDPRVAARMDRADEISGLDYLRSLILRQKIADTAKIELQNTVILLPTVAILPPQLSAFDDPKAFDTLNLLALRNTSLANVIDGCSLSLPMPNLPGAGFMLTGCRNADSSILKLGLELEQLFHS